MLSRSFNLNLLINARPRPMVILAGQAAITVWMTCLIGCASLNFAPRKDPLTKPTLTDKVSLPSSSPTLQDLAFTFPVFEMRVEQTKDAIQRGGFGISQTKTRWMLEGDGAQPTIVLDVLSPEGREPIKVSLTVGSLVDESSTVYIYERIYGGWRYIK